MSFSLPEVSYFAVALASIDFMTIAISKFIKPANCEHKQSERGDFSILIPIFGHIRYLKNVEFLSKYEDKVILCTTDREIEEFYSALENISRAHGFRIHRSPIVDTAVGQSPNPWRLFKRTLHAKPGGGFTGENARDEIIRESFGSVDTRYCIFLDGDTAARIDLSCLVCVFEKRKYDLASVRVLASKQGTLIEKLQSLEYALAMDARRVYPWLTSGAAMIAKTRVIKSIMQHHSLFFSGGDIEIGKLAKTLHYKVGHLPFIFETDVPSSFSAWFKQRRAWFGGGFRHAIVNFHFFTWKQPLFFIYTTLIVYLSTPLRWYEAVTNPTTIPLIICIYWVLIVLFQFRSWKWWYLIFPFYSLVQVMIVILFGTIEYFRMVFRSKNIGIIKLRHAKILAVPQLQ